MEYQFADLRKLIEDKTATQLKADTAESKFENIPSWETIERVSETMRAHKKALNAFDTILGFINS
jgi:hypothetical protein